MSRATPSALTLFAAGYTMLASTTAVAGGDHHMHIQSEDAVEIWDAMCEAMPDDCDDETSEPIDITTGSDAVRVLFATDWDEVDPISHITEIRKHLSLSDAEWSQLMSNEAPYLKASAPQLYE